jgi:hypothetical protein
MLYSAQSQHDSFREQGVRLRRRYSKVPPSPSKKKTCANIGVWRSNTRWLIRTIGQLCKYRPWDTIKERRLGSRRPAPTPWNRPFTQPSDLSTNDLLAHNPPCRHPRSVSRRNSTYGLRCLIDSHCQSLVWYAAKLRLRRFWQR